jgi:hypothetical protein
MHDNMFGYVLAVLWIEEERRRDPMIDVQLLSSSNSKIKRAVQQLMSGAKRSNAVACCFAAYLAASERHESIAELCGWLCRGSLVAPLLGASSARSTLDGFDHDLLTLAVCAPLGVASLVSSSSSSNNANLLCDAMLNNDNDAVAGRSWLTLLAASYVVMASPASSPISSLLLLSSSSSSIPSLFAVGAGGNDRSSSYRSAALQLRAFLCRITPLLCSSSSSSTIRMPSSSSSTTTNSVWSSLLQLVASFDEELFSLLNNVLK